MFWQFTDCLFSLNNFAVSFGFLVKWSKLDTKLFSYIGLKIHFNHYYQTVDCSAPFDNLIIFKYFFPSLFQCGLPLLPLHNCYFLVCIYIFISSTHENKKKRLLNFQRSFLLYTEYNIISWIFISLCPTYASEGWKQMYLHVVLMYFMLFHF